MKKQFTCIVCPNGCEIEAEVENGQVISVTGHTCPRGEQYVRQELTAPRRTIASSVLVKGGEILGGGPAGDQRPPDPGHPQGYDLPGDGRDP